MPQSYVTVTVIKGTGAANIDGTAFDTRLRQVAEAVSSEIDRYTGRFIQPRDGTFFYGGDGGTLLLIHDTISLSGGTIVEDDNNDGTFDLNWADDDFLFLPRNAEPTAEWGRPYTALMVNPKSNGTQDAFLAGPERYRLIGTFGYVSILRDPAVNASGSLGTGTAILVDGTSLEPGQTILIDTERIYIRSVTTGTSLTVDRGVQNTVVGTHASGTKVQYYDYPAPIKEAAFMQTVRLWQRRNSGFASSVGLPETGMFMTFRGLDDDVKLMLNPYRRIRV